MHTRRVGAFLIGAWILGCLLLMYAAGQNVATVERILGNPPLPIAKELTDIGSDVAHIMFRHEAMQATRRLYESWGVMQLGLMGAFFATAFLTSHRSKFLIIGSAFVLIMIAIQAFYLTPIVHGLGRSLDFLPPNAAPRERENLQHYETMFYVAEALKLLVGVVLAGRLLFDRYDWKNRMFGDEELAATGTTSKGIRKRKRRVSPHPGDQVQTVNHPDDSHVDG